MRIVRSCVECTTQLFTYNLCITTEGGVNMLMARVNVKHLVNRITELKEEQSDYSNVISNLKCDYVVHDTAAVRALRVCKQIVDTKITRLENLVIYVDDVDKDVLDGVNGVRYTESEKEEKKREEMKVSKEVVKQLFNDFVDSLDEIDVVEMGQEVSPKEVSLLGMTVTSTVDFKDSPIKTFVLEGRKLPEPKATTNKETKE